MWTVVEDRAIERGLLISIRSRLTSYLTIKDLDSRFYSYILTAHFENLKDKGLIKLIRTFL